MLGVLVKHIEELTAFYLLFNIISLLKVMVKYLEKKEDCELLTSHSVCTDSEPLLPTCTLTTLIQQVPKLTPLEKRNSYRMMPGAKNNSRKWSQV